MEQPTHQPNPNTPEPAQPVTAAALEQGISQEKINSLRTITIIVYVLQALTYFTAITGIIGLIINYVKRGDAQNTWLANHFRWQIRTFYFGLLSSIITLVSIYFLMCVMVVFVSAL